eukprot:3031278-Alexandrium_andersonii.AAC.1
MCCLKVPIRTPHPLFVPVMNLALKGGPESSNVSGAENRPIERRAGHTCRIQERPSVWEGKHRRHAHS